MSFGWSASDIYQLVVVCYQLVDTVREGAASAPQLVKDLNNELSEFTTVLDGLQKALVQTKDIAFINFSDILQTIQACDAHLKKYRHLHQSRTATTGDSSASNNVNKLKDYLDKVLETSQKLGKSLIHTNLGGDQELRQLQKRLARHRQTLSLYLQIVQHKRNAEEQKLLINVQAMVKELHAERRQSAAAVGPPQTHRDDHQHQQIGHEDYRFIFQALNLNEQKHLALLEAKKANDNDTLQEWNDILDHLELIHRRILNAAERTANFNAQQRTASASYQISLNHILTPHHTPGTPPLPLRRTDTHDSGYSELAPVREESSGLNECFVQEGILPTTSNESVSKTVVPPVSRRRSRTFSTSSSEVSFPSANLQWKIVQFNGWVKFSPTSGHKPTLCNMYKGCDSNNQVLLLQIEQQYTNDTLLIMNLSRRRRASHTEPFGERDNAKEGMMAYFLKKIDTEPKDEGARFFFQNEKSLKVFESIVYGQTLLCVIVIEKIFSSKETHSDRQRLRVWSDGDNKSLLFYASKSRHQHISVQASEIASESISKKKNAVEFKLHANNSTDSHNLKNLQIVFSNRSDLDVFRYHFLSN